MSERIPKSAARPGWIVFDADACRPLWNGSSIWNIRAWKDRDAHEPAERNRVKWRPRPALVHRLQHDLTGTPQHDLERVALTSQQQY